MPKPTELSKLETLLGECFADYTIRFFERNPGADAARLARVLETDAETVSEWLSFYGLRLVEERRTVVIGERAPRNFTAHEVKEALATARERLVAFVEAIGA